MDVSQRLLKLLYIVAEEQGYDDIPEVKQASNASSIMSSFFIVSLRTKRKKNLELFVKIASSNVAFRSILPMPCPYTMELYFYRTIRQQYERLEQKYSVPKQHGFPIPKLYGSDDEYLQETLVLENLIAQGYKDFDKHNAADLEYMSAGIASMAQFHALSLAYSENDPEGFARTSEYLPMDEAKCGAWLDTTIPHMMANTLSAAETHKEKLRNYFEKPHSLKQLMDYYRRHDKKVLIHGDFKPGNLMHRRTNGKLEIIVVDYQMVRDGDPVTDLMYFIFTATDGKFRRVHYKYLLDLYYECLRTSLIRLQVDPEQVYSEKTYRTCLEDNTMLGLAMAVALLPVVFVDDSKVPYKGDGAKMSEFAVESSALFKERLNGVLDNYVEWGLL